MAAEFLLDAAAGDADAEGDAEALMAETDGIGVQWLQWRYRASGSLTQWLQWPHRLARRRDGRRGGRGGRAVG